MARSALDIAIASKNWDKLVAAIEADDNPAAAVQRAEPTIAHWPDDRRELAIELWRELASGAEPPPWLPLTRHLRLEHGDDLDGVERMPWLTSLDLTDFRGSVGQLRELPALRWLAIGSIGIDAETLGALTQLETLRLVQPQYWIPLDELELPPGLRALDIRHSDIATLDGLAQVPALQRLDLVDNKQLSDVAALAGLPALEWLSIVDCTRVADLSAIAGLTGLRCLYLRGLDRLEHLPPLDRLTALRDLGLGGRELHDLGPLSALSALEGLAVYGLPRVGDLAPLGALASLRRLGLNGLPLVADASPLGNLARLEALDLSHLDRLADLAPLASLHALRAMTLDGLPLLRSIRFIAGLPALENILITYCPGVDDIAPLAAASALRYITLRDLGVRDVSPLAALPHLQQIGIALTPPPVGLDAFDARRTRVYNPSQR